MKTQAGQGGFTLIELVVVITILGILAAFAVPRFSSLEVQARTTATQALGGGVRSGAALAHALWLAQGGTASSVSMEGTAIALTFGYPTAASIQTTMQDATGFGFAAGVWTKTGAPASGANCKVTYTAPTAANTSPTIAVVTSSC